MRLMSPRVSVITPSWRRPMQLARCMMSVAGQSYHNVEHVIVFDGPEIPAEIALFTKQLARHYGHRIGIEALPEHDPEVPWGCRARRRGAEIATGQLIAWLDDDDAYRPDHIEQLATVMMADPDLDLVFSRMWIGPSWPPQHHAAEIALHGGPPWPDKASMPGAQMIMHRRELLDIAMPPASSPSPEWDMISAWLASGAKWQFVNRVTVDAYCHED